MTDDRLPLAELMAKTGDSDFLRSIAESVLQLIMEADVDGVIGPLTRLIQSRDADCDAFVIACYSDPGLHSAREVTRLGTTHRVAGQIKPKPTAQRDKMAEDPSIHERRGRVAVAAPVCVISTRIAAGL